jgi:hypothetical protein
LLLVKLSDLLALDFSKLFFILAKLLIVDLRVVDVTSEVIPEVFEGSEWSFERVGCSTTSWATNVRR